MDCISIRSSSGLEIVNLASNDASYDDDEEKNEKEELRGQQFKVSANKPELKNKPFSNMKNIAASSTAETCSTRPPSAELSKFRRFVNKIQVSNILSILGFF